MDSHDEERSGNRDRSWERFIVRKWLTQLWRLRSPRFCNLQTRDLAENNVSSKISPKVKEDSSSVQSVSHVQLPPHGLQHASLPCPSTLGACSNSCPSGWWCHPTVLSCRPLLLLPSVFPSIRVFYNESVLPVRGSKYWRFKAEADWAWVLPMNIQDWFPLRLTSWSPSSARDSQGSSPTPYFKGINSSALGLLYGPALISIHDYWKNHSFE